MATIRNLSLDGMDPLGIDEFNRLYWHGEPIVTATMLHLPSWVEKVVATAAILTAAMAIITAGSTLTMMVIRVIEFRAARKQARSVGTP